MDPAIAFTGLVVGMLVGLTGIGGGALMTPFLILVLGTRPVVAVGTDLVYGAVTKIAGSILHWKQGTVDLALARRLAVASVPAGLAAVLVLRLIPDSASADAAVRRALGVVLLLVALLMLVRVLGAMPHELPARVRERLQGRGTPIVGGLVGALVGFTSVGSGALLVPFLLYVFPLNAATIVGTDVFHAALLLSATAAGHAQGGFVDWGLAANLLVGSIPGVAVGSWMAPRVPARALRVVLACLLLASGYQLL
ncbi:MAG: sulfite exporter TauE/SafE family protein [Acidobacteria bacterium]|nr:sulfite exporter TauE/SafE family protein [Acidobacteriota bacterium]